MDSNIRIDKGITTYGALILPFDITKVKPIVNAKEKTKLAGQLRSALQISEDKNLIWESVKSPVETFQILSEYMKDERQQISGLINTIGSKFSGIAVAQAIANGKVTAKEAADYLFMGFAPALGATGSLFGYSGLNQLKDALTNGSINVGSFISGFTRTLKGIVDLKDNLTNKDNIKNNNIIEFDLTISHSETYQSETPDRRVQSGQSLNEYIHNMPDTFSVSCALQDGRRYSIPEFRAIMQQIRNQKEVVSLVLGDEIFDNLILTDFSPNSDCSKSGMDYSLSFKKITRSDIDTTTEVTIQQAPELVKEGDKIVSSGGLGSIGTSSKNGKTKIGDTKFDLDQLSKDMNLPLTPSVGENGAYVSTIEAIRRATTGQY